MKLFGIVWLMTASLAASAGTCRSNQAFITGYVTDLKVVNLGNGQRDCTYKLTFTEYFSNTACPLDYALAKNYEYEDFLCEKKLINGDLVTGTLTETNGFIRLK